ncbi:DUF3987 domain-containing protein [Desulfovibrio sp. OttesenSCG-928-G11]|nr:DUF3987 domain-containing protein [Desulfovibrio sp. OttesenSCG-928-G11]
MIDATTMDAALSAVREAGLLADAIEFDGQLHRVPTSAKPKSKNGAYIAYGDAPASLWWQDWASGESGTWTVKGQSELTASDKAELTRRMEEARKAREAEQARVHAEAASKAQAIYAAAADCTGHPYLERKGVTICHGLKLHKESVVVPLYDEGGKVASLQFIDADGNKRFLTGGRKKGCFFSIRAAEGGMAADKPLVICEGLATGLSLHQCLELPVLVAFDAGNLLPVAEMARARYSERIIILAADYDEPSKAHPAPGGTGIAKATAAALAVGGSVAVPRLEGRALDWNDLHQKMGAGEVRVQFMTHRKPDADCTVGADGCDSVDEQENHILPPPPPVPLEAFPPLVAAMMEEAAAATTAPLQITATCFLAFLSCLVGRSRLISIKPGWEEAGNLWLASVASSGMGKSPCMDIFFRVITRLEYEAKLAFDEAFETYETELVMYQVERNLKAKEKVKGTKEVDMTALLRPEEPKQRQTTADDVTVEALGDILQGNPKGVLWLKDELSGLLFDLDKYSNNGGGGTKARLLSSHSLGPWKTNRSSNPNRNNFIPKACVGIFGGIQPGVMSKVFEAGAGGMDEESGFLPRFLFIRAVAEAPAYWNERTFSPESKALLEHIAAALWPWDIEHDDQGREIERIVPVSRQAKDLYIEWFNAIAEEAYLAESAALLRKLQAHALRLCLLLHCLDAALAGTDGMSLVTEDTMRRALLLADWAKEHQEQCWRFFTPEKGAKQADPIERAIMQVVVDEAARIEADGWKISNADLCSLVEGKLNMPGLSTVKIGKAASGLGMGQCKVDRNSKGRSVTKELIDSFKSTVRSDRTDRNPHGSRGKIADGCHFEPTATDRNAVPSWGAANSADGPRSDADGTRSDVDRKKSVDTQGLRSVRTVRSDGSGYNPVFDFNDSDFSDEDRVEI